VEHRFNVESASVAFSNITTQGSHEFLDQTGSWNRDDVIIFYPSGAAASAIQRVFAAGGQPADVIRNKGASLYPTFLPDGRHFLYLLFAQSAEQNGIYLASLDSKENRRVLPDVSSSVFAAGRLLFIRENTLIAGTFDEQSAQIRATAFQ
jgi:hypothetical protein